VERAGWFYMQPDLKRLGKSSRVTSRPNNRVNLWTKT
jgi:hypothetical protein